MRWSAGLLLCLVLMPHVVSASVRINEVAWMGTEESYLCNWVELYNQSDAPVDVTDWTLEIDDTKRALQDGEGEAATVPGGGFLLLERVTNTCPNPVPAVDGWYLALGNLPNRGATLTLRRADNTIADRIVGGEDWQTIGGDNDTKDTAQRTSNGWITAAPTPGAANRSEATVTANDDNDEADTSDTVTAADTIRDDSSSATQATPLKEDDSELTLKIDGPATTYVGQPVTLTVTPTGTGAGVANSLHYQWNFGDRHTTTKPEPRHSYAFPGTYVVTVRGTYADFDATARHEITVLPVRLTLGRDARQNLQIHNEAPYEIDLSGYTVSGIQSITFPERTILLPDQTITIEQTAIEKEVAGLVTVQNQRGESVASNFEAVRNQYATQPATSTSPTPTVASAARTTRTATEATEASSVGTTSPLATASTASTTGYGWSETPPPTESASQPTVTSWMAYWPYGALGGLVAITAAFLFWPTRRSRVSDATPDLFT